MSVPTIRVSDQAQSVPVRAFIIPLERLNFVITGSQVVTGSHLTNGDRYGPKYLYYQANDTGSQTITFRVSMDNVNFVSTGSGTSVTANTPVCITLSEPWQYCYGQVTAGDWAGDAFGQTGSIWLIAKSLNA